MGVGPKLFEFKPGKDKDWQLIGNLSAQGIKNISRLAIDPDGSVAGHRQQPISQLTETVALPCLLSVR